MKIEFYFWEDPIRGYTEMTDEHYKVNKTIKEKVHYKVIEIPFLPTKEMEVDISSFEKVFGFSKKEMEWLDDCNGIKVIAKVVIKPTHLEVWLE